MNESVVGSRRKERFEPDKTGAFADLTRTDANARKVFLKRKKERNEGVIDERGRLNGSYIEQVANKAGFAHGVLSD